MDKNPFSARMSQKFNSRSAFVAIKTRSVVSVKPFTRFILHGDGFPQVDERFRRRKIDRRFLVWISTMELFEKGFRPRAAGGLDFGSFLTHRPRKDFISLGMNDGARK